MANQETAALDPHQQLVGGGVTCPPSSTSPQQRLLAQIARPAWLKPDAKRHPTAGYLTRTGHYLNAHHLMALDEAAQGVYQPDFDSEIDEIVSTELRAAELLTHENKITEAGLWYLRDRWPTP
jgi:hypothetical protein